VLSVVLVAAPASGAPDRRPPSGGTVIYGGNFGEPVCLNPFRRECIPGSTGLTQAIVGSAVLDAAFDIDPKDFSFRPGLVSRAEFTREPPFRVIFHIDRRARWSDGVPVTSRDFVFTVNAARRAGPNSHDWFTTKVRRVRAIDSKSVEIVFRSRYAGWRSFGTVLPAHALEGQDLTTFWRSGIDNPKTGGAIGSGPYLVERWERGKQIVLRRNPNYWGGHLAYLDRILVRFNTPGPELAGLFRNGEIDVATHMPPSVASALRREEGIRVFANQRARGWDHLEFRIGPGGHPALRNKLVRQAIAHGIDRVAIVERFLKETSPNVEPRHNVVFPERTRYYRKNWAIYGHRPDEARRLLEQAQCFRGPDGLYECSGRPLSLRLMTTVIAGGFRDGVVQLIQTQLRRIGVQVVPVYAPGSALFNELLTKGNFDVALFAWISGPDAAATASSLLSCNGTSNWTGYCQRLVTADLAQAERILDPELQARALNRIDASVARDVPVLPLYQQTQALAVRTSVRNVGLSLVTQANPLWNAENWWLDG
jgi:peptide/nickel transport system substrate-binding protein